MSEPVGTTALVVENPHHDEITRAWSTIDARKVDLSIAAEARVKLAGKVQKQLDFHKGAIEAQKVHAVTVAGLESDLAEAQKVLAKLEKADPDLAAACRGRREAAIARRRDELVKELDALKGDI